MNLDIASMLFNLIGGLGIFLYGMRMMSEGLQKVAGDRLRSIFGMVTSNRFAGVFTGFLVTAIIQSSSATTVMLVGFVNAGLMSLQQAIHVIFSGLISEQRLPGGSLRLKSQNTGSLSSVLAPAWCSFQNRPG